MAVNASELRAAIEHAEFWQERLESQWVEPLLAASQERLAQIEADPELVERLVTVLRQGTTVHTSMKGLANALLAALTPPPSLGGNVNQGARDANEAAWQRSVGEHLMRLEQELKNINVNLRHLAEFVADKEATPPPPGRIYERSRSR